MLLRTLPTPIRLAAASIPTPSQHTSLLLSTTADGPCANPLHPLPRSVALLLGAERRCDQQDRLTHHPLRPGPSHHPGPRRLLLPLLHPLHPTRHRQS